MEGKRFIQKIKLTNFLSFGPEGMELELEPLNVLIGPNASGKSNFIEAFRILQATPNDLAGPFRQGGGVGEWLWKGEQALGSAGIEATASYPGRPEWVRYRLRFGPVGQRHQISEEVVENEHPEHDEDFFYRFQGGRSITWAVPIVVKVGRGLPPIEMARVQEVPVPAEDMDLEQSVLSQRKDPVHCPEITYLGQQYDQITLYREWQLGARSPARSVQPTDLPPDHLLENASNLFLVLMALQHRLPPDTIEGHLRRVHPLAERMTAPPFGNAMMLHLHERGLETPVSAARLSDGTLRYLCLLSILLHPEPPPLVCIEEPELGLHPDMIRGVAELLVDASRRTQLVVTTHSDYLVSALGDVPEAVVVCERDDSGTHMRRLEREGLGEWLKEYTLGDLWSMGELGGNRW